MPSKLTGVNQGSHIAKIVSEGFSVVFAGNIGKAQSCETIIEAAKLLKPFKDIKFYLVGNGSMAKCISKNIKESGLDNVIMTGRVPPEDMASIYASASALLLTLRDEPALSSTLPSKLQSYFAAGKPVIASCNGEAANVVNKANAGITCSAGDANALAETVIKLYKMPHQERERLGENGREYFTEHYQLENRVAELITHFNDVVVRHSGLKKSA
jgi:glycosyltransferase involved in cell wall biosynthesis